MADSPCDFSEKTAKMESGGDIMRTKGFVLGMSLLTLGLLAGCSTGDTPNQSSQSSTEQAQTTAQSTAQSKTTSTNMTETTQSSSGQGISGLKVSVDEAIKIFQETYSDADITSLELDTSFGNYFYKVEGVNDEKEVEIRIDGATKKVEKEREEMLDADDRNGVKREEKLNLANLLSIEKAAEIAETTVGAGEATDWDLDKELNITYWEVTVVDGNQETNVKLNAQSGEVIETEIDD